MIYKPMIAATALVVASCCFSAASAAPAKGVRSAPAPTAAQADTPFAAYLRRDVPALTAMAEAGSAEAQYNLGVMYDNGLGVAQDYAAAVSWYRKAADQGNAPAQSNLGVMYYNGRGVPKDLAAAAEWFRKAANQQEPDSAKNLVVVEAILRKQQLMATAELRGDYPTIIRIYAQDGDKNGVISALTESAEKLSGSGGCRNINTALTYASIAEGLSSRWYIRSSALSLRLRLFEKRYENGCSGDNEENDRIENIVRYFEKLLQSL